MLAVPRHPTCSWHHNPIFDLAFHLKELPRYPLPASIWTTCLNRSSIHHPCHVRIPRPPYYSKHSVCFPRIRPHDSLLHVHVEWRFCVGILVIEKGTKE